jgi:hypothetical protein
VTASFAGSTAFAAAAERRSVDTALSMAEIAVDTTRTMTADVDPMSAALHHRTIGSCSLFVGHWGIQKTFQG